MAYVHISSSPGADLATYQQIKTELGSDPVEGRLLHIVGESAGALQIVDVWESKAVADRFAAERLFPAFERAGVGPGADASYVTMDATVTVDTDLPVGVEV